MPSQNWAKECSEFVQAKWVGADEKQAGQLWPITPVPEAPEDGGTHKAAVCGR